MNKILIFFIICLFSFSQISYGKGADSAPLHTIEGDLHLLVKQKKIKADLKFWYVSSKTGVSDINIFLSHDVNVDKLEGEHVKSFTFNKKAKPFPTITILLKNPLKNGETANFDLSYSGKLSQGFWTGGYGWIDLDPDFMTLPAFKDFEFFSHKIHAETDDPAYKFIDVKREKMSTALDISADSVYYFESIVAGKTVNFDQISQGGYSVNIISNKPDSIVSLIGGKALNMLDYFNNAFGDKKRVNTFTIIYRPMPDSVFRTMRNMYEPDKRYIMFSDNHERFSTLAHEVSHFWWNRGNTFTMEKWLVESFAQYSEMMYMREAEGQEKFQKEVSRLENEVKDLPSILQSDRFAKGWSDLLYEKGPFLLYQLEETIGREKFNQFLSRLNEAEISDTDTMLRELKKVTSEEVSIAFKEKLMK